MKKKDLVLILVIFLVTLVSFFMIPKVPVSVANISVNGKHFSTVSLDKDCKININGTNIVVVENGQIYMKYADCPDKLCIKQGKISDSSKKIVCLPNKVIIEALNKSNIDMVVK